MYILLPVSFTLVCYVFIMLINIPLCPLKEPPLAFLVKQVMNSLTYKFTQLLFVQEKSLSSFFISEGQLHQV